MFFFQPGTRVSFGVRSRPLKLFHWRFLMSSIKATDARVSLYRLLDEVAESHKPVLISGKRSNAVLVSEDDWRSIQETLHLLSVPGGV